MTALRGSGHKFPPQAPRSRFTTRNEKGVKIDKKSPWAAFVVRRSWLAKWVGRIKEGQNDGYVPISPSF